MTIADLRTAVANAVETIDGLRTSPLVPDQVNPPLAVVYRKTIQYAQDLDSASNYSFGVSVYAGRASDRTSEVYLDTLCEPTGSRSVKQAIEPNQALLDVCDYVTVNSVSPVQVVKVGDIEYLMVDFTVEVVG